MTRLVQSSSWLFFSYAFNRQKEKSNFTLEIKEKLHVT